MTENPSWLERIAALDPAIVRGVIVTVVGIIVAVTGKVIDNSTVELISTCVLAILGLLAAILIRPAVTPNAKVLAFKPDPVDAPLVIQPGEAVIEDSEDQKLNVLNAALSKAA